MTFVRKVVATERNFEIGDTGLATAVVLHQGGQDVRGPRIAERTRA